jgi:hypothetical protein
LGNVGSTLITLAHYDAIRRGHPRHQKSMQKGLELDPIRANLKLNGRPLRECQVKIGCRSDLGDRVFTFFAMVFTYLALQLGWLLLLDLLITSIVFIFSGNFESILQKGLEKSITYGTDFFTSDIWKINSGLEGLDLIINWFIGLQYNVADRWIMFALCSGIAISLFAAGVFFDFKFIDKSSNPQNPNDISLVNLFSLFSALALISPIFWGGVTGFCIMIMEFFIVI